jgi:hypothetical protein
MQHEQHMRLVEARLTVVGTVGDEPVDALGTRAFRGVVPSARERRRQVLAREQPGYGRGSDIAERVDASAVDRRVQIHHALGVEGRDAVEVEAIERSHHICVMSINTGYLSSICAF